MRKKEREKSKSMKEKECEKSKSTKEKSQIFQSQVPEPKDAQQGEKQWSSQSTFVVSDSTQLSTLAHPPPPCLGGQGSMVHETRLAQCYEKSDRLNFEKFITAIKDMDQV